MWTIYISLCLGILIGASNKIPKKIIKLNDKLTLVGILSLLFVMGISIGTKKEIINKLEIVGFTGFLYALFTALFSIIVVYILTTLLYRRDK